MNYTTLEQSKKLIELGLDPKTADMKYEYATEGTFVRLRNFKVGKDMSYLPFFSNQIPCWSLGALIELMPKENELPFLDSNPFIGFGNGVYRCVYLNGYWASSHQTIGNTAIDACVNMVLWLLENNYIKKEFLNTKGN